jgi:hypothetical protein
MTQFLCCCIHCCVRTHQRRPHRKHRFPVSPLAHFKNVLPCHGFCLQSLPSNGSTCYTVPSFRLFVPNSLQAYRHFFFSEGCACDNCNQPRLPSLWLSSHGDYSPTAPSLRPLVLSSFLIRCKPVQVYHHQLRSRVPFHSVQAKVPRVGDAPTSLALKLLVNVQSLTSHNPMEIPTTYFMTSSLKVCLTVLVNALLLPRHSYCFRPQFLIPLFRFCCVRCLFSNFSPLAVPHAKSFLVRFFHRLFSTICSL